MANKAAAFERARTILVGLPGVEVEVAWRLVAPKSLVAGIARRPSSGRATRARNT